MRNLIFSAMAAVLIFAGSAQAAQITAAVSGVINSAQNLTFAVINGNLLSSNPELGDLPLGYTGTLTVDTVAETAEFFFEGSFMSPTRSYTFDITAPGLWAGFSSNVDFLTITDVFGSSLNFAFNLDLNTGSGFWSWRDFDSVPTSPAMDRFANATITSADVSAIPLPAAAWLLAAGLGGLGLLKRKRG